MHPGMGVIKFRMAQYGFVQLIVLIKLFQHRIERVAEAEAQIPFII